MPITEEIERAIMGLSGPNFQRFADDYVKIKFNLESLTNHGVQEGATKTTKGLPDSYGFTSDGHKMFFMYGAHNNNVKSKVKSDIQSIKELLRGNPDIKVVSINTVNRFNPDDEKAFKKSLLPNSLQLIGIFDLAQDLLSNLQMHHLIVERLGLSEPSSQVMDIHTFVNQNERIISAPTLKNDWVKLDGRFRSLQQAFNVSDVVMISGNPGIGKTRTVLEFLRQLDSELVQIIVVKSVGKPAVQDIKRFLDYKKTNYIFLDDVTNVVDYKDVVQMLESTDDLEIKIVGTLRSYLKNEVIEKRISSGIEWVEFSDFDSESLNELVEGFGVKLDTETKEMIKARSKGNPRVVSVFMTLLQRNFKTTGESVFLDYYKQIVLEGALSSNQMKILAILSIQKFLDLLNIKDGDVELFKIFSINKETVKEEIQILNRLEIVNIFHDKYARIQDQSLGDYAVYSLYRLMNFEYLSTQQIASIVQSVLVFDNYDLNIDIIKKLRGKYQLLKHDEKSALEFLLLFGSNVLTETFSFVANWVNNLPEYDETIDDVVRENTNNLNTKFRESELIPKLIESEKYRKNTLNLIRNMLKKRGKVGFDAFVLLKRTFDFTINNSHLQFDNLNLLLERWDELEISNELKSKLIREYLVLTKSNITASDNKSFQVVNFEINDTVLPRIMDTRKNLISKLAATGYLLFWVITNIELEWRVVETKSISLLDMDEALKYDSEYDNLISGYLSEAIEIKHNIRNKINITGRLIYQIIKLKSYHCTIDAEQLESFRNLVYQIDDFSEAMAIILRNIPEAHKSDIFSGWVDLSQAFTGMKLKEWILSYLSCESKHRIVDMYMFRQLTLEESVNLVESSNAKDKTRWLLSLALEKNNEGSSSRLVEQNILLTDNETITRIGFSRLYNLIGIQTFNRIQSRLTDDDEIARFLFGNQEDDKYLSEIINFCGLDRVQNLYILWLLKNYSYSNDVLNQLFTAEEDATKLYLNGFVNNSGSNADDILNRAIELDKKGEMLVQTLNGIFDSPKAMPILFSLNFMDMIGEKLQSKLLSVIQSMSSSNNEKVFYFIVNILFNKGTIENRRELIVILSKLDYDRINWSKIHFAKTSRTWSGSEVPLLRQEVKDIESYVDQFDPVENLQFFDLLLERINYLKQDIENTIDREYEESLSE